ncbi:membrane-associated phosphatidylinositol transfer protein 2 isoform X1 [Mastacembelus armatus]|uniref:membrane-associated phosphatidylinositol transfer protein 2 isoform X1 n=1 Tax=Mastacembelus armatus TaxID=205130 RepID=UPI000E45814E|nr:membrane-associated phosphatidylinositol transfer protein 2-like isoform X1 [Mastacembelus armatus]XP_026153949.1 membrane-associated phosphatidylinositol transfer protein 2-like isoform X1 [Mastacembelus armatus]XP_026153950.1 membrane-associated phosphatidylinositol transfer protein 2-like isoform X1 [Mastacembelus armatus]XP_026153951.1 membrane-associated phosphatidylinositol transfer protein 2-like isoform X1 [Mastacembelus armatus]
MLIKEYRIPMPMSVEEYRIAQLYMIQKKSREESCGEGSGVEILENKPYENGPGGSGQYTHKVYHIGKHIPSWFCAILPQAALRVEEESWNAYPYTRTRYTCPFVEKFSIDIETYYKPDTGNQVDVFNLSSAEKRQRTIDPIDIVKDYIPPHEYLVEEDPKLYQSVKTKRGPLSEDWIEEINESPGQSPVMCAYKLCKVEFRYWGMQSKIERFIHDVGLRKVMVRAHRQAWCWQDEWYGLSIEDIRQLELETQLALAKKMAQYSLIEEAGTETNGSSVSQDQEQGAETGGSAAEAEKLGDSLESRGELTKQWSTSSRSSNRSSKRGGSPSHQSISEWRMQSIARDSEDSTDDEFFDAHEDFSDNEEMFAKEITKWNSNDLMDKIETMEVDEAQETLYQESGREFAVMSNEETQMEDCSTQQCLQPSKIHVLVLVLHGGNILDTGSGEQNNKQGDVNTLGGAFETVMRVHYPTALGHIAIRTVPCPAVCVDAFSLVSNLSPYSYDESCLSSSQDHIPLAALPLLATSAPQYQDAVATVILRANQVYSDFIKSLEGASFSGQVCVIGDCVGGILGFDALCSSSATVSESQNSSRRGSTISAQDTDLLSPGMVMNSGSSSSPSLEGSRHLSRSNIDIPRSSGPDDPKKQLPRKRSDSSTYELDTIKHHQAFLSSLHSSVLHGEPGSRRSSNSTMLEGGSLGKFDFEVTDFFLFGSPLGLVLALRKTVVPSLDVSALRPACQQVYNLFHPADPSASRLEPLLDKRFYLLPPFSVPRYQRFPLGDGHSALLVETVQSNPQLLMEPGGAASQRCQDNTINETSIPVPVLNWQTTQLHTETDPIPSHIFADGQYPSSNSPGVPHLRCNRRASEASIASQVSGLADSYTASNIATIASRWWGSKRMDYALYCPDALTAFPTVALPHLFHASYWESTDVVSFLLRQVMRHENSSILELDGKEVSEFTPSKPREKWLRKRTHVKIRNVTANHRVNDAVFTEDGAQMVTGRFMYGPLDMVTLTGEKIDIHIMTQPPSGEWVYFDTELTNSSGRVSYVIPDSRKLGIGVYPVKMVVRGDHTSADSYLTIVPRGTEFVVFSIDGSFAASVSIMGSDPKVRAGAVDVVRYWQDLGYLIVYVTGRPDMQKQRVVAWLSQHNFPHGVVSFCDGLVHDPLRHKANFLKSLISEARMRIFAAYGSTKDISVYTAVGLPPSHIYIVGRPTKKMQNQCQFIADGYASHLSQLEYNQRPHPAKSPTSRMVLRKGSFGLGAAGGDFLRKRNHMFRTISTQQPGGAGSGSPNQPGRTERTLSQCEGERERGVTAGTQRSMSIAAGCWGRSASTKEGGGGLLGPK